mgnify:CR=1 FL=1
MVPELAVPQKVIDYVTRHGTISVEEVMQALKVSRTTAKNYLSRLTKMDIAKRIGRGIYQVGKGATVTIRLPPELSMLANDLRKRFPMAQFAIWSLGMLADYAHYAVGRDLIVLETNKILSASIRDALTERGYRTILNPEKRDFREYAYFSEKTIFILERSEKYGLIETNGILIPTPERVWLDLYYFITRKELSFSPGELGLIFANMLRREGVNFNRFLRYAQRRNIRDEMIIFLYSLKQSSNLTIPDALLAGKKEALQIINEMAEGAKE